MKSLVVRNLSLIAISIILVGCGGYNKLLKSTDNELKYKEALKYYKKKDWTRASQLFEKIGMAFDGTEREDTVSFYEAKCYYMLSDYEYADSYLTQFCRVFGRSKFAEEAYYLKARNAYRMSYRTELDQSYTLKAISSYNEFHATTAAL